MQVRIRSLPQRRAVRAAYSTRSLAFAAAVVSDCVLRGAWAPPHFNGLMRSMTYPGNAPDVLPVGGQGWTASNALLAAGPIAILPLAVWAQMVHFFVEDPARATAERRSERAADRGALRCAERAVLRLLDAHVGTAASRRQSARTKFRIIMKILSVVCVGGKWGAEQSVAPGSFCVFAEAWRRSRRRQGRRASGKRQSPGSRSSYATSPRTGRSQKN